MPKEIEAIYNPSDVWKPVEEGEYPAHVTTLSTREVTWAGYSSRSRNRSKHGIQNSRRSIWMQTRFVWNGWI